nr:LacI family DNA-binding transcriptional regulator [Klebsiella pneumoniae]
MASLKDVAKLANVSLMTVSRALNTPERLKPETLARVQAATSPKKKDIVCPPLLINRNMKSSSCPMCLFLIS